MTVSVDRLSRDQWSACLGLFDDASIYESWAYPEVVFPRQTVSRLALFDGDDVAAMAQARVVSLPVSGVAYVAWGPLWRRKGRPQDPEVLCAALEALREEFVDRRGLVLRVAPGIASCEAAEAALAAHGFSKIPSARAYRTLVVDLDRPLDAIRAGLASKWRNRLNRAEREGLAVRSGASSDLYAEFLSLYRDMRERKSFESGVDAERWVSLADRLPEGEKPLVFLALRDGKPLAGAVVSCVGDTGVYLLGATGGEGLSSQASYALQWRAIETLKGLGAARYDLGGIDPEAAPGVYHFKSGLGGCEAQSPGVFQRAPGVVARSLVAAGDVLRAVWRRR